MSVNRNAAGIMDLEWLRRVCLELPNVTEQIQWGSELLFKVQGKMFAVAPTEPAPVCLSFKCSEQAFVELTERPGIIPAPYLARAKWVALETQGAIPRQELAELLRASYQLILAKLPKRLRETPAQKSASKKTTRKKKTGARRKSK